MNNSEPTLTPDEEKLTAFLDGKLSPADAAAFEREHPEARQLHEQLRSLLSKDAPHLKNGEFFNHQILREIQPPKPAREKAALFPLWRLAFAAVASLVAAAGIYFAFVGKQSNADGSDYFAQVVNVKAGDPDITAQLIDADGIAVVWIDGLASLPNDYVLE